jgi:hypothetical protein
MREGKMLRYIGFVAIAATLIITAELRAAQFVVDQKNAGAKDENPGTADQPFKTINKAASVARAGDTVTVKAGVYREFIGLYQSGTATAPIIFRADPPGSVVISGADVFTNWEPVAGAEGIYSTQWNPVFVIGQDAKGQPVEFHPDNQPLWGRAEQAVVDSKQLKPCANLDELRKGHSDYTSASNKAASPVLMTPLPNLGPQFNGMFAVDTRKEKKLYLWLADGSDPRQHQVELATRDLLMGTSPWAFPQGTQYVQVNGFIFRYGATFPQRAAVWLHGKNNLIENCIIEDMTNGGVGVNGTLRHCVIRRNGQCGGGAYGDGFVNEESLWEGNCWRPIDRGWDAGALKICLVDGGTLQRCVFRRNGGPGLWFDIHARNILVTECAFIENEGSGLFIEISRNIRVVHNLSIRNALDVVGKSDAGAWSSAGIQLGESMNCFVGWNTCVGNRDGIAFREQGPRIEKTADYGDIPYHDTGDVIVSNICADNAGYPFAFWSDNAFFGPHPSEKEKYKDEESWQKYIKTIPGIIYNPVDMGNIIDRNLYAKSDKPLELLYGVPWRPNHQVFTDLAAFSKTTGFDPRSRVGDPQFENAAKNNFRPTRTGLAWEMQVGWLTAPTDIDAWMNGFLPAFR